MTDKQISKRKDQIHEIIFEADTPLGKWFDIILLVMIIGSIIAVMLETVPSLEKYQNTFFILEWLFTILFTIEYGLRMYCVRNRMKYAKSFFGIVDLVSILPAYISLFIVGTHALIIFRALRLLRVFRIFKLGHFLQEGDVIMKALRASRAKISVFLFFILYLLGGRDFDDGRLRRYFSGDRFRQVSFSVCYDFRLRGHCSTYRNCLCRNGEWGQL